MVRRHGWQLPFHSFQVLAITVFFLLSIAFYAFFAPFLGKDLYEYVALAVYSTLALSVFILYVRCTAIDPADSQTLVSYDEGSVHNSQKNEVTFEEPGKIAFNSVERIKHKSTTCSDIGCFVCALIVKEDCRKDEDITQQQASSDDGMFCTLCNVEVRKFSKHCQSCDKCVDGFDHHCRWLNNCIGRKNYITFLSLMAMSIAWLAVEFGVGIAVLIRCFTDKRATESQIRDRLGDGFSRAPFAAIVAVFTAFSLLATVPLGELFFFHMILIRKGITTYAYVVAMRNQSEPPGPSVNEDPQSFPSSPMSSIATGISGSSLGTGLQYRGAWCTPPRIFVDHQLPMLQDEIIPHLEPGRIPSTVDPDAIYPSEGGKRQPKRPVRISAWKLAKLDSNEAVRAAAKARASSSVMRPISSRVQYDADRCSIGNVSSRSSTATDIGLHGETQTGILRSPFNTAYPHSLANWEDPGTCPHTPSTLSSPRHVSDQRHFNPIYQTSVRHSPWSERTNEGEEEVAGHAIDSGRLRSASSNMGSLRSSVYWDQEAGRFVSSQNSAASSSSRAGTQTELLYTGHSIFFGGPLVGRGSESGFRSGSSSSQQRQGGTVGRGRRPQQLPVFAPRDSQDHLPMLHPPRLH